MTTKAQMQSTIHKQEETIEALKSENATLKSAMSQLEDLPKGNDYGLYERRTNAAMLVFNNIAEWATRNYGSESMTEEEREAYAIGILLSKHFHYCGDNILLTAAYGCEDSNWHDDSATLMSMYEANIAKWQL